MTPAELSKLKPTGDTASEIRAALARVAEARAKAEAQRAEAQEDQAKHLAEGASPKDRAATAEAIGEAGFTLGQLDQMEPILRDHLAAAEQREAETARADAMTQLEADAEAVTAEFEAKAPALIEALQSLIDARAEVARRAFALTRGDLGLAVQPSASWVLPKTKAMFEAEQARQTAESAEFQRQQHERLQRERARREAEAKEATEREERERANPAPVTIYANPAA